MGNAMRRRAIRAAGRMGGVLTVVLAVPAASAVAQVEAPVQPPSGFYVNAVPTADTLMLSMVDVPEETLDRAGPATCEYAVTQGEQVLHYRRQLEEVVEGDGVEGFCPADLPRDFPGATWPIEGQVSISASISVGGDTVIAQPAALSLSSQAMSSTASLRQALEDTGWTVTPTDATPWVVGHTYSFIWEVSGALGRAELAITTGQMGYLSDVDCACDGDARQECTACGRSHRVVISADGAVTRLLHGVISQAINP